MTSLRALLSTGAFVAVLVTDPAHAQDAGKAATDRGAPLPAAIAARAPVVAIAQSVDIRAHDLRRVGTTVPAGSVSVS